MRDTLAGDAMSATRIHTFDPSPEKPTLRTSSLKSCGTRPTVRFVNCPLPTCVTNASNTLSRSARKATSCPSAEIAASTSEPAKSVSPFDARVRPTAAHRRAVARVACPDHDGDRGDRTLRQQCAARDVQRVRRAAGIDCAQVRRAVVEISSALCHRSAGCFSRHFITMSTSGAGRSGRCVVERARSFASDARQRMLCGASRRRTAVVPPAARRRERRASRCRRDDRCAGRAAICSGAM